MTIVNALQELLLPDWNNAFIVVTIGPKGILIPKIREKRNWLVGHGHSRTKDRLPGVLMYDGPTTVKSLLRTEVSCTPHGVNAVASSFLGCRSIGTLRTD